MKLQKVTHKQARILKELGFPLQYAEVSFFTNETNSLYDKESGEIYELPYLELVAKWLREEKNLNVMIGIYNTCYYYELYESFDYINLNHRTDNYPTYEEALSAGIDKAIEKLKNK